MQENSTLAEFTIDDLRLAWASYQDESEKLTAFIKAVPVARLAHDAAVRAMNSQDEAGRSLWEGYLRALYMVSHTLDAREQDSSG